VGRENHSEGGNGGKNGGQPGRRLRGIDYEPSVKISKKVCGIRYRKHLPVGEEKRVSRVRKAQKAKKEVRMNWGVKRTLKRIQSLAETIAIRRYFQINLLEK